MFGCESRESILRLVEEHPDEALVVPQLVADDLHRREPLDPARVARAPEVDRGHAAAGDLHDHVVVAQTLGARGEGHDSSQGITSRGRPGGRQRRALPGDVLAPARRAPRRGRARASPRPPPELRERPRAPELGRREARAQREDRVVRRQRRRRVAPRRPRPSRARASSRRRRVAPQPRAVRLLRAVEIPEVQRARGPARATSPRRARRAAPPPRAAGAPPRPRPSAPRASRPRAARPASAGARCGGLVVGRERLVVPVRELERVARARCSGVGIARPEALRASSSASARARRHVAGERRAAARAGAARARRPGAPRGPSRSSATASVLPVLARRATAPASSREGPAHAAAAPRERGDANGEARSAGRQRGMPRGNPHAGAFASMAHLDEHQDHRRPRRGTDGRRHRAGRGRARATTSSSSTPRSSWPTAARRRSTAILEQAGREGQDDAAGGDDAARRASSPSAGAEDFGACDFVVEAATENVELKLDAVPELRRGDEAGRDAREQHLVDLAHEARRRRRRAPTASIGMHFMNPPPLMKLVEIVRAVQTSDETYAP